MTDKIAAARPVTTAGQLDVSRTWVNLNMWDT